MFLFFVLIIAVSGIFYQLLIGTITSFLIGDSILQFSLTIGFSMAGMGLGSYLSRFLEKNAVKNFLNIEIILSILGGTSVILLKLAYLYLNSEFIAYYFVYILITLGIGVCVGCEIPLVISIYKSLDKKDKKLISNIFTFDYIGSLIASILFPLLILPFFGVQNTAILTGILNLFVAFFYIFELKKYKINLAKYYKYCILAGFYLILLFSFSLKIENIFLKAYFRMPILLNETSQYQDITLTKEGEDFRMYLGGHLQFMSLDEERYHESLVDWPMNLLSEKKDLKVLVMGAGDGLAVRNLLEYDNVFQIDLVELDKKVINIASTQKDIIKLNKSSLKNTKVNIIVNDAFKYLEKAKLESYDFIIADFPDPRNVAISKLYSKEFYALVYSVLKPKGVFVTQASSSFFAKEAFSCIKTTINGIFGNTKPYHKYIPSFGDWGFVLATKGSINKTEICPKNTCEYFDKDYNVDIKIKENRLSNPVIINYYLDGYRRFNL